MAKQTRHKNCIVLTTLFSWVVFIGISFAFFSRFETINYYNFVLEFIISCIALVLLYSVQIYKNLAFYKTLAGGFYLLFVSYFVDSIDQIFHHSILYTVIMEKLTLITSFVLIYIGSKQWVKNYQKIALTDDLTQLPNRKLTKQLINKIIESSKNNSEVFSLIIIDIDFFKKINDKHGHLNGDCILKQFSKLINSSLETNETMGRWGGEEFILIKKNTDKKTTIKELDVLRKTIANHIFIIDSTEVQLTASFGVSEFKNDEDSFKSLFVAADKAMYNAKNSGRNRIN